MFATSLSRKAVSVLSLVVLSSIALAEVRVVGPGQTYANVQAAISAASNGDTILVKPGTYPGFTIDNKTLSVIGDGAARPVFTGSASVANLSIAATVALSHLHFRNGLSIHHNSGHVRVADVQTGMPNGTGWGCEILDCAGGVAIASSTLYGAMGWSGEYSGYAGNPGISVKGALVAVHDSTVQGGRGGDGLSTSGNGGDGAYVAPSTTSTNPTFLHSSGSTFTGGSGGDTWEDVFLYFAIVGDGGNGLSVMSGASAWRIGCTYVPGPAGQWHYCDPLDYGTPGQVEVINGFAATFAATRVAMSGPTLARESTPITLAIDGAPGDFVYLQSSKRRQFNAVASLRGVRLIEQDDPWFLPAHSTLTSGQRPIARLDASGHANVTISLPELYAGESARTGFLQVLRVASDGSLTMGAFLPLTIVDSSY